jgi:hypothetical protein
MGDFFLIKPPAAQPIPSKLDRQVLGERRFPRSWQAFHKDELRLEHELPQA